METAYQYIKEFIGLVFMTAALISTFLFLGMVAFWAAFLVYQLGRNILTLMGIL